MSGDISDVKSTMMFKNAKYKYKLSPRFLYFAFLNIYRLLNIANIILHDPDDGSVEPKCYSVDFLINLSFHLDYLVINFSTLLNVKQAGRE